MSYATKADLGGQPGFGKVVPEAEGELFHAAWEPRALALVLAMGATGSWNIDASRSVRETLPDYSELSYYRIWLGALEQLMLQRGQIFPDEIASGEMSHPAAPVARVLRAADVPAVLAKGSPAQRPAPAPARFAAGQEVRMRLGKVGHHTRLPAYVQGRRGTVVQVHGAHVFADTNAQGLGEQPQWLYTVEFDEAELWGEDAPRQNLSVSVDAWESYLEAAA
ncbi:nitrile hydratase subunit beta [Variovorax guangxiensis]|uniref:Nitrile hydratase subunit beta n=1 Tax=Variovorax guangxiensis TaxID=1775474 RepID=A0A3S0ZHY6_9BURK|nr:nitrile hydratase subunit beta [Variovorax guangxiensis]RUR70505.1 nitrile hydratase subunit beta [Variovorax guangxiensis]